MSRSYEITEHDHKRINCSDVLTCIVQIVMLKVNFAIMAYKFDKVAVLTDCSALPIAVNFDHHQHHHHRRRRRRRRHRRQRS